MLVNPASCCVVATYSPSHEAQAMQGSGLLISQYKPGFICSQVQCCVCCTFLQCQTVDHATVLQCLPHVFVSIACSLSSVTSVSKALCADPQGLLFRGQICFRISLCSSRASPVSSHTADVNLLAHSVIATSVEKLHPLFAF